MGEKRQKAGPVAIRFECLFGLCNVRDFFNILWPQRALKKKVEKSFKLAGKL